jgi:hypothetical protein
MTTMAAAELDAPGESQVPANEDPVQCAARVIRWKNQKLVEGANSSAASAVAIVRPK